jgi:NAD(P)-dependent dehydrogenase (short-subunit alcohol dehydrogenase family)
MLCLIGLISVIVVAVVIIFVVDYYISHQPIPSAGLKGKAVLITGCDTGFGRLTAQKLDSEGDFRVFAGCLTQKGVEELKEGATDNLVPFLLDVTSDTSIKSAADFINKESPDGLWAIINNAGLLRGGLLETTSYQDWKLTFEVNVFGMAMITKALIPSLRKIKNSRVVNISSIVGRTAMPGTSAYSASKFAVQGLSDALRRELVDWGVNVVIIQPGIMKTPLYDAPFEKTVDQLWDQYPETAKEAYGKEFVAKSFQKSKDLVTKIGGDPNTVVAALCSVVKAKNPPHRKSIGKDAPFWIVLSLIPSSVGDYILKALNKGNVPLAAQKKN